MIDFSLSDDQKEIQKLAREFTQREIVPVAAHYDQTGEYPREIVKKAWEIGLMNIRIPPEYDGLGLGALEDCLITEEISAGCTGFNATIEVNNLSEMPLILAGSEEQKKRYLTPMAEEFRLAAYCITEPDAGSDVKGIKTLAKRYNNEYVINGSKVWITNGGVADWYYVVTYTDPEKSYKGMTSFIVDRDTPGIEVGKKENNMGQKCSDTRAVTFNEVKVPEKNRLGGEGEGWKITMRGFDHSRPAISAGAVGLARAAMKHAIRYAQERTAFGVPIYKHEAVSFMIADMAKDIEAARLLVWLSAWTIDQGKRNTLEAAYAKAFAADMAMRVATDAVQVFGGYGYSREYPVEKLMRDAKVFQIYEGTSQIQRLIIAKEIFERGKEG